MLAVMPVKSGLRSYGGLRTVRKTKKTWKFRVLFVVLQAEI